MAAATVTNKLSVEELFNRVNRDTQKRRISNLVRLLPSHDNSLGRGHLTRLLG